MLLRGAGVDADTLRVFVRRLAIEIEEHRLVAHIARELRGRQATIEKKALGGRAGLTLAEVHTLTCWLLRDGLAGTKTGSGAL